MDAEFYNRIRRFAKSRFFKPEDQDDFTQFAALRISQGRKASFRQLHYDYLRMSRGDERMKILRPKIVPYDDGRGGGLDPFYELMEKNDMFNWIINSCDLKKGERVILRLLFEQNMPFMDLCNTYNVSFYIMSNRLKAIYEKIKRRIMELESLGIQCK